VPSSGSIDDAAWEFAGNPYATTIDWDDVTQTNVTTSAYVWDSQAGTPAYISWNGSSGSLSNGLIAPYQGFFVRGSAGGSGSITIAEADKSSSAGTFYKTMADSTGSMSFTITSVDYSDQTFVSFMENGEAGMDNSDAYKLLPMTPSERVVGISYAEGNGLAISNLPYSHEGSISIPLDVMYLTVDDDYNFVTNENEVTMSWDLSSLPETVTSLTLTDNTSGSSFNLDEQSEVTFTTVEKGSFPAYGSGGVNIYPEVGESRFTLSVAYSALTSNDDMIPKEFTLHPVYPNPFNPSTTISFDIPAQTHSNASLRIYDITGRLVATLVDEQLAPGTHTLQWQPVNLSSGLYIVQLKAGNQTFNQKISYIK
ncbi:MAG: T9SS type A sorting domain-containing protein, partial [Candidatus Marinimicrobia bacterium]|nr:T9SS type A sorting domain-containing protein [Candidatus Neomarinimicrobiota bacterium]